MRPALEPGDRLLVRPRRVRTYRPGEVVAVRDPRDSERVLVKRVILVEPDRSLIVLGDNRDSSSDSLTFGPVPRSHVLGRVVFRYHPAASSPWVRRVPEGRLHDWIRVADVADPGSADDVQRLRKEAEVERLRLAARAAREADEVRAAAQTEAVRMRAEAEADAEKIRA
ncbi:MAG: S26 family signal peptidase, partial [Acidimicrobiia bacterium]